MGIFDDLDSVFTTMAPNIMGASMALTINPTSFDSLHYTVEGSVICLISFCVPLSLTVPIVTKKSVAWNSSG